MSDLKLAKLPDRTPVKLAITVSPELNKTLQSYAQLYSDTYGQEESVTELIPFMLDSFLQADRRFLKAKRRAGASVSVTAQSEVKNAKST